MSDKVVTHWKIPEWEGPRGDAQDARNSAEAVLNAYEQMVADIDNDPRTPREGRPTLRREAATKAREALKAVDEQLGKERAAILEAEHTHLFGDSGSDNRVPPYRQTEIRSYLASLDEGKRHAAIARAVESGDVELLESIRRAPAILGFVDARLRMETANALAPTVAESLEARREAVQSAHAALDIASRRLESDSPVAQARAEEARAKALNAAEAGKSLGEAAEEIAGTFDE